MDTFIVVAFRSRTQSLHFKRLLTPMGVEGEIISTPIEISIGCGISVKMEQRDLNAVKNLLYQKQFSSFVGVYLVEFNGMRYRVLSKLM